MTVKRLFAALLLLGVVLFVASAGASSGERIGGRIHVITGPATYPAGQPFHIAHGYTPTVPDTLRANGRATFVLDVDGVPREADFIERGYSESSSTDPDDRLLRIWVFNFPAGMTGTHTFTGHWYVPCASDPAFVPAGCQNAAELVEGLVGSVTVTFVSPP